jgi:hypothetical protein
MNQFLERRRPKNERKNQHTKKTVQEKEVMKMSWELSAKLILNWRECPGKNEIVLQPYFEGEEE